MKLYGNVNCPKCNINLKVCFGDPNDFNSREVQGVECECGYKWLLADSLKDNSNLTLDNAYIEKGKKA